MFTNLLSPSIYRRLLSGFAPVIILVVIMGAIGYFQLSQVRTSSEEILPNSTRMELLQSFALSIFSLDADLELFFVVGGARHQENVLKNITDMADIAGEMKGNASGETREHIETLEVDIQTLEADVILLATQMESPEFTAGQKNDAILSIYTRVEHIQQLHQELMEKTLNQLNNTVDEQKSIVADMLTQYLALAVLTLLISLLASAYLSRRIAVPLSAMSKTAARIADGDLHAQVKVSSQDETGKLAMAFNSMAEQLRSLVNSLETRVQERTRDLQTAADVSRQITTVLDIDRLLEQIVLLTTRSFGLYAGFVFLLDSEGQKLALAAGTDTGGQLLDTEKTQLFTAGLSLDAEPSIIALAARIRQAVVVNDVTRSADFMAMEALPETRSELAIPMILGDHLLGIFDIQSRALNHFGQEELRVLTAMAEQIAIAVRNAQLFAAMRAAQEEAERANRIKSQFLAAMSHELRTPLNGILNFTGFVADKILGPINDKQEQFLRDAIDSAEHLLALINDILDISKIESDSLTLFVEDHIDLQAIFQAIIRTGEALLKEKTVTLIPDIQDNLPYVQGDKRRIQQILFNLLSNACKFTDEGSITITVRLQNEKIFIAVKDTGPGIESADHEEIFKIFTQTKAGLRKGGGTGLGLPISKKLTELHGGRLWLESQPGKGATFFVELPVLSGRWPANKPSTSKTP